MDEEVSRKWHLEVAGVICVAWTKMRGGSRSIYGKWLHPSTLLCLIWAFWVRFIKPHFLVIECVPAFDHDRLFKVLGSGGLFTGFAIVCSPKSLGFPCNRPRKYMFMWLASRFTIHLEEPVASFQDLFFRKVVSTSAIFLIASEEEVLQNRKKRMLAKKWKFLVNVGLGQDEPDNEELLDAAHRIRLHDWQEVAAKTMPPNTKSTFINLTQTTGWNKRVSPIAPTLVRGSFLWDIAAKREVIPYPEHFAILGFPVGGELVSGEWAALLPWAANSRFSYAREAA